MRTHVGTVPVEITRPESAKFHHPLLLLHGLWTGAWIWQPFATYLAHRGWESWAPSFTERDAGGAPTTGPEVANRAAALERVLAGLPATPVILAHDVGVLGAATSAARGAACAVVAIAPVVSPAESGARRSLFAWPRFWHARLGGARVAPPAGAAARALLGVAMAWEDRLTPDSGPLFRAVASGTVRLPARIDVPGLVVAGGRDPIVSADAVTTLAGRYGWEERTYPDRGHYLLLERGWEAVVDDVHRWIIRAMGAELLAFLDDVDEPDPL